MHRYRNFIPSSRYANLDMVDLPDCIALSDKGDCRWLNTSRCIGKSCSFKQTKEENWRSLQKWKIRLSSLENAEQKRIAAKYYDGTRPWCE
ncbi:MAG: hypothetical protein AB9844_00870 [Clostridiaceae bacterium]